MFFRYLLLISDEKMLHIYNMIYKEQLLLFLLIYNMTYIMLIIGYGNILSASKCPVTKLYFFGHVVEKWLLNWLSLLKQLGHCIDLKYNTWVDQTWPQKYHMKTRIFTIKDQADRKAFPQRGCPIRREGFIFFREVQVQQC